MATHAAKSEVRKIKMKLKMNNLPTIPEESQDALIMDQSDIDKLLKLNEEITQIETEQKANQENDPVLNEMRLMAERVIENEMQQRRKEFI